MKPVTGPKIPVSRPLKVNAREVCADVHWKVSFIGLKKTEKP
jgi:hypothetical protein